MLQRAKLERYVTASRREEFLAAFIARALLVEPKEDVRACRDPRGDKFLELAVGGSATHIVTGDNDLLVLHPFRNIAIMTPAEFLQNTEKKDRR